MDTNSLQFQALVTFLAPCLIQLAKRSQARGLAWIGQNKPKVCMVVSALTALATSTGITFVHTSHQLVIGWPDGATIARGFVASVLQFAAQHALYEGFWRHIVATPASAAVGGKQ